METAHSTLKIGGGVNPRASLDDIEKLKILYPNGIRTPIPQSSSPEPVFIPTSLTQTLNMSIDFVVTCFVMKIYEHFEGIADGFQALQICSNRNVEHHRLLFACLVI
jgi:hypothetical protein